ncbi:MAG: hypothetical protein KF878_37990 [Planctomycetes bacterium]|nr:hypothetical protein [Planctomycetota bacterium]
MSETQISAYISDSTRRLVEEYAEAHGVKKGFLIEEALLHHLQALRELPADVIIPPRLLVDGETAERLRGRVREPRRPTRAMRELFGERGE